MLVMGQGLWQHLTTATMGPVNNYTINFGKYDADGLGLLGAVTDADEDDPLTGAAVEVDGVAGCALGCWDLADSHLAGSLSVR